MLWQGRNRARNLIEIEMLVRQRRFQHLLGKSGKV